jgi:hypothetical protein
MEEKDTIGLFVASLQIHGLIEGSWGCKTPLALIYYFLLSGHGPIVQKSSLNEKCAIQQKLK